MPYQERGLIFGSFMCVCGGGGRGYLLHALSPHERIPSREKPFSHPSVGKPLEKNLCASVGKFFKITHACHQISNFIVNLFTLPRGGERGVVNLSVPRRVPPPPKKKKKAGRGCRVAWDNQDHPGDPAPHDHTVW